MVPHRRLHGRPRRVARHMAAASPGARLDPPLLLALDEIGNLSPLPSLLAPHWAAAGQRRTRSSRRSRPPAKHRPSSVSRRPSRTWSGRSRCGTPFRTRPSSRGRISPSSAPGPPSSPAKRVPPRVRSSSDGERSSSPASTTHDVRESSRCASGSTSTPPAAARPCSPHSNARLSSSQPSHPHGKARMRWGRSLVR